MKVSGSGINLHCAPVAGLESHFLQEVEARGRTCKEVEVKEIREFY